MDYSSYPPKIRAIVEPLASELTALFDSLSTKQITLEFWRSEFERLLAKNITASFMVGRGKFVLSREELSLIRQWVAKQLLYLDGFAADIENWPEGEDYPPKWSNRMASYATSVVPSFYSGKTWGIPLPAMPGDLTSQCGQADKCTWEIDTLEGEGNWDATWTLHPAEHCQTCIERARLWNPLQIRNYQLLIPDEQMAKEFAEMVRNVPTKSHNA